MGRDDKWVVAITTIIAVLIISYFTLQKFSSDEEAVQASYNDSSASNRTDGQKESDGNSPRDEGDPFWEEIMEQDEVDVWLYGTDSSSKRITSIVEDNWPADAEANIHNESDNQPFLVEMWLKAVEAEPLLKNSWVLLQWDDLKEGDLTTLENLLRQLLKEQPQLAITVVSESDGGDVEKSDIDVLQQAYGLAWVSEDELAEQLPDMTIARLPEDPLYDGTVASNVERVDSTNLFHGDVEVRPISSEDNPFMFDQYYAMFEQGSQVDYEVEGSRVGLVYLTDSNGGIGTVELDGEGVAEIDCYSEKLSQRVAWIPLNGDGKQTLSIKYTGESNEDAVDSQVFVAGLIVVEK